MDDETRSFQQDLLVEALIECPKGLSAKEISIRLGMDARKRISELRAKGYEIEDRWEQGVSRFDRPCRYKVYFFDPLFRERLMGHG